MADERRGRLRGLRTGRRTDPSLSEDPRIRHVLEALTTASQTYATIAAPAPFRDELRTQLVAITPRLVAESTPGSETPAAAAAPAVAAAPRTDGAPRHRAVRARRRIPVARPLAVVASLVVVLAVVLGGAVWLSRDAVPGDTLYGLKRASENVQLSFDDNNADRAADRLSFATTRVNEARTLVRRATASAAGRGPLADGRLSAHTARQVADVLRSADTDTREATRLLSDSAVTAKSAAPLGVLTRWAPQQRARLNALQSSIPTDGAAGDATAGSLRLLATARQRAEWVTDNVHCGCLRSQPSDSLGPMPGASLVPPRSSSPTAPSSSPARPSGSPAPGRTESRRRTATAAPRSTAPAPGGTTPSRTRVTKPPSSLLPTAPKPTASPTRPVLCHIDLLGIKLCPSKSAN